MGHEMDKLKFTFQTKPTTDGKSNYIAITSIATQDEKIFLIPEEYQAASLHRHIYTSKTYITIKNTLKKRHQTRSVWIKVTEDIFQTYFDDDGNMIFQDQFLEEITQEQQPSVSKGNPEDSLVKVLEKLIENQNKETHSIERLTDRFVIQKFDGKAVSASHWMEIFEKECARFDVEKDEEKIEILRLFLERSCTDWYSSMMIKFGLQSEWCKWKSSFLQTYANKGWSASKYVLSYKYQLGSLVEYAVKKERLLLEVRKTIDQGTLVDIIAAGLPDFITDRISKEDILETKDLFNELGKLEHMVMRKKNVKTKDTAKQTKESCKICEKLQKGTRYHSEDICWFKPKNEKDKKQIRLVNNSELECELQCDEPKNF